MESTKKYPKQAWVEHPAIGYPYPVPSNFILEKFYNALNYQPRKEDVFISTFPKSGTTWVLNILQILSNGGKSAKKNIHNDIPWLEESGCSVVEELKDRPKFIKTHLAHRIMPWSSDAKYIYVARNPKDCLTSYYYHTLMFPSCEYSGAKFDDYFEVFMEGRVAFGDYFSSVGEWYEKSKTESNICLFLYEDFANNFEREVKRLAEFVNPDWTTKLLSNDEQLMKDIVRLTSFKEMQSQDQFEPDGRREKFRFIRKGVIGDWKNHMSQEQSDRVDQRLKETGKLYKGFDQLWKNYQS